jgi:FAD/FMN-containing dehydrogenase
MEQKGRLLANKLGELLQGTVLSEPQDLRRFNRDQSIYQIEPLVVALPANLADVQLLIAFAAEEGLPITARGGGSGTVGSALGSGIVMALPEVGSASEQEGDSWNRIVDFSSEVNSARVCVGAGVYHNRLQNYLKARGFFLPADVSSADISRICGNIATKASGPHALKYGSIDRFIEGLEFVTDRGELVNTADERTIPPRFMEQLSALQASILEDEAARTFLESRAKMKIASGYNLFAFIREQSLGQRLAQLLAGSVGTLGLVVSATLRAEIYESERAAVLLYFDSLAEAARAVGVLREAEVSAIELISRETVRILRQQTKLPAGLAVDANLLLVEVTGSERFALLDQVSRLLQSNHLRMAKGQVVARETAQVDELWALRKQLLWLIRHPAPNLRALSVVNDVGVPPENLAAFVTEVEQVFARHEMTALIYGHAGSGNLHLRPLFDINRLDLAEHIRRLADEVYGVVFRHGGTITAEHGMGRLRAPYLQREWGSALYDYMRQLKKIFDPQDLFNPGVMFNDRPITDHLRSDFLQQNIQGDTYG